jgi:glucosamine--fructose-6-phosphate aminotransferase (isomerizing)
MCGIVGYIGSKKAQPYLIGGLHRLEYRGYDSAGIVTIGGSRAMLARAKGKVSELETLINKKPSDDTIGIGHTRWATHGEPSETNAHPHCAGDIFLVHNGIIENYKELKAGLKSHKFASQTDTEVLAALINSFYNSDIELVDAVTQALKLVVGTYGIAVVSTRNPDEIVVARNGSPLIIGIGKESTYIASDASALIGHTNKAIYLNDGEIAVCTKKDVSIQNLSAKPVTNKVEKIEVDIQAIQKQGYDHFLLKEICEQPQTLASTLSGRINTENGTVRLGGLNITDEEFRKIEHVVIVGCGTAYYAGLLGMYYLEQLVDGLTVDVAIASELRYRSFHLPCNSVALIISQSGETADTLACLREIKRRGVKTLGIVNVVSSTIAREVDGGVYVHAGPEISVASTKAFTSQVAAITMFGVQLAQAQGRGAKVLSQFVHELALLPNEIEAVIKNKKNRAKVKTIAKKYAKYEHAFYFGRDTLYPVALEGALKLKEISYIQSEGYAAGELKHGPIALVDDRFFEVALLLDNWLFDKSTSNLAEINARGGHIIAITNSKKHIDAEEIIRLNTNLDIMAPVVINVVQQLFAYFVAVIRGNDIDQPRNLAKSVTVE